MLLINPFVCLITLNCTTIFFQGCVICMGSSQETTTMRQLEFVTVRFALPGQDRGADKSRKSLVSHGESMACAQGRILHGWEQTYALKSQHQSFIPARLWSQLSCLRRQRCSVCFWEALFWFLKHSRAPRRRQLKKIALDSGKHLTRLLSASGRLIPTPLCLVFIEAYYSRYNRRLLSCAYDKKSISSQDRDHVSW